MRAERPDAEDEPATAVDHDTPLHLWPENWPVWCLWRDVETQWRPDHIGLDYTAVRGFINERFRRRHRRLVLWLIQGMEEVTLAVWRERQARERG